MKPIKITKENVAKIEAELKAINGRASSFAVTLEREVREAAEAAEEMLKKTGLPKAARTGARFDFRPAGPSAKKYKYRAVSTSLKMERRASGWFLTEIASCQVYPKQSEISQLYVTEAQAEEIKRRSLQDFRVMKSEAV